MPSPIDLNTLSLNLGAGSSPQQRLDSLMQQARQNLPFVQDANAAANDGERAGKGYLSDQINELNAVMYQYGLRFELSDFDSQVITRVIDRATGEVIRQIPSEEMLRIAKAFADDQGRLVDASA
ncbi:flagellar protein FlaG [Salinicola endophyticus]|uniref:Flagellar protein FlaG n=1 Tax=Salinicola endophyticus TaxID=1949083 RepID=A0ABY8FJU1_9GAMM|nr:MULTISPECIES: flagellar protein FlaG [Salinicola]WFF42807.1 flagellar protein FlaG [Salinicola endophyticus]